MKKILAASALLFAPMMASAFELGFPVQCELNKDCFIQNYVDSDSTAGYSDYHCGKLTYNTHDGTDFRVRNFPAMERGVNVLAAAPGTVLGFRDEIADTGIQNPDIKNKECGNGVLVQHAEGWQTQYCHMKRGSITVKKGQMVQTGDVLGQVGFSGQTEFPHMHLSVRHNGKKIDPFTAQEIGAVPCSNVEPKGIWAPAVAAKIAYNPTHLLDMGLTTQTPDVDGVRHGKFNETEMNLNAPLLALWVDMMGTQADDRLLLTLTNPSGVKIYEKEEIFAKPKAAQYFFIGLKNQAWVSGAYTGSAVLTRGGQVVFSETRTILARP